MTDSQIDRALARAASGMIAPRKRPRRGPMRDPNYLAFLREECRFSREAEARAHRAAYLIWKEAQ